MVHADITYRSKAATLVLFVLCGALFNLELFSYLVLFNVSFYVSDWSCLILGSPCLEERACCFALCCCLTEMCSTA